MRAEEGLIDEWRGAREQGSKGGKLQGRYPEEGTGQYTVYTCIHKPSHNAALAIDTLLLQMKNSDLLIALSRCRRKVIHVSFACAIPVYIIHVVT